MRDQSFFLLATRLLLCWILLVSGTSLLAFLFPSNEYFGLGLRFYLLFLVVSKAYLFCYRIIAG